MAERNKAEKFVDLAQKRVRRVMKELRLIGNLLNRSNYTYTDKQVKKIVSALRSEIRDLQRRFDSGGVDETELFTL